MKKSYKNSQYNCYVDNGENLLIFNNLTKNIICVPNHKKERVCNALQKSEYSLLSQNEFSTLLKERFIVDKNIDESVTAIYQYNSIIYDNTTLNLVIVPTMSCNFKCVYCPQTHNDEYISKDVTDSIIKYIQRNSFKYKRILIDWFGGEPLLCKTTVISIMKKVYEICENHNIILVSSMTTNGYELDINTFNELVKYGIRYFQISIDGNKTTHNKMRPHKYNPDSYERIMNNLITIKNETKLKMFTIGVRINVSKSNYSEIDSVVKDYQAIFKNDTRFQLMWQWVRDWGGNANNKQLRATLKSNSDICRRFYEYCIESGLDCVDYMSCKTGQNICEACKANGFVINYDGSVYKCAMMLEQKDLYEQNRVGSINKYGKIDFDINKVANWVVSKPSDEKCRQCSSFPLCMGNPCPLSVKFRNKDMCIVDKSLSDLHIKNIANKSIIKTL